MSEVKKHLSASSLGTFSRCGEAWRRRYIERDVVAPTGALIRGKAFHHGAAENMRQKIDSGKDMTVADIQDVSTDNAKNEFQDSEIDAKEQEQIIDVVATMAQGHVDLQAPSIMPEEVEKEFRIELPDISRDFLGYIDVVGKTVDDGELKVVDWKTSKKSPNATDVFDSIQLTAYASHVMTERNLSSIGVRLDHLILTPKAKAPKRKVLESVRDGVDVAALGQRVTVIAKSIDAGIFPPAAVGSWNCSEKWCGYWKTCPYVNAERKAGADKAKKLDELIQLI